MKLRPWLFTWAALAVLLIGCAGGPPIPVVSAPPPVTEDAAARVEAVTAGEGFAFDLRAWLEPLERQALADFLADVPRLDHPDPRDRAPWGETHGWKGPFNTSGYGIGEWVRQAGHRYQSPGAATWLRAHVLRNVYNYWIYFAVKGRGPNEGVGYRWVETLPNWIGQASVLSGISVTELVHHDSDAGWLIPEADKWDGSSYDRHHCYDFLANAVSDPAIPLTDRERELACAMLEHYASTRLENARQPIVTHRHEWGHYPIRTYVAIYRLFKTLYRDAADAGQEPAVRRWALAQRCLRAAEGLVWWGWHPDGSGRPRAVAGRNGDVYWAWDQEDPAHPGWHQLNQIATERPWYVGLRASAWFYLWSEPDTSPWIRDLIAWVICEEARWCSREWGNLPPLALAWHKNATEMPQLWTGANGWIQGGLLPQPESDSTIRNISDRWIRSGSRILTPDEWAALPPDTPYHPLTCIKARESDNGYFARWWPNPDDATGFLRWHYPKIRAGHDPWPDAYGPRLDINGGASWAGMPDVLFLAGMLQGDVELVKLSIWLCHDYVAFSHLNHSGATLLRSKAGATSRLYGGLHKTRGFYWIVMCGEILRMAAMGANPGLIAPRVERPSRENPNPSALSNCALFLFPCLEQTWPKTKGSPPKGFPFSSK